MGILTSFLSKKVGKGRRKDQLTLDALWKCPERRNSPQGLNGERQRLGKKAKLQDYLPNKLPTLTGIKCVVVRV